MGKKEKRSAEYGEEGIEEPSSKKKIKLETSKLDETAESVPTEGRLADLPFDEKLKFVSTIAEPMASRKMAKKLFKLIKKASKHKTYLRSGLKDVQLRIRRGETGIVIFAGDVTPIEIMCHLPAVCEEKNIQYVYVPLRQDIAAAMGVNRPCLMVMVRHNEDYDELYKECEAAIKGLELPIK